jgi:hypothetical protein
MNPLLTDVGMSVDATTGAEVPAIPHVTRRKKDNEKGLGSVQEDEEDV